MRCQKKGVFFPLKKDYERINGELFDPRITDDDYEPQEEAMKARAPIFGQPSRPEHTDGDKVSVYPLAIRRDAPVPLTLTGVGASSSSSDTVQELPQAGKGGGARPPDRLVKEQEGADEARSSPLSESDASTMQYL